MQSAHFALPLAPNNGTLSSPIWMVLRSSMESLQKQGGFQGVIFNGLTFWTLTASTLQLGEIKPDVVGLCRYGFLRRVKDEACPLLLIMVLLTAVGNRSLLCTSDHCVYPVVEGFAFVSVHGARLWFSRPPSGPDGLAPGKVAFRASAVAPHPPVDTSTYRGPACNQKCPFLNRKGAGGSPSIGLLQPGCPSYCWVQLRWPPMILDDRLSQPYSNFFSRRPGRPSLSQARQLL
ncbi:hypothetical protein N658DRAFT_150966 [Parathielavia hyrcaniae]|uniref:Uncharacterized protein n=1 Tax=Parathielavia hyrcaniae TaxID=113614 RepID=A0AAN6T0P0_9PEZI|nr:hypothetical protein N658DRAFT_150966 [Parathielavia hyrcaniae]